MLHILQALPSQPLAAQGDFFSISISNVVTWGILLIGGGISFQTLRSKAEQNCRDILSIRTERAADRQSIERINEQGSLGAQRMHQVIHAQVVSHETRLNNFEVIIRDVERGLNDIEWMKGMMQTRWGDLRKGASSKGISP